VQAHARSVNPIVITFSSGRHYPIEAAYPFIALMIFMLLQQQQQQQHVFYLSLASK
jgi:hypothetical protein